MLETERLVLRPLTKKDVDVIFALRSNAEMMRFIREPQKTHREAENWIKLVSSLWKSDNIGFFAVIEKQSKEFIGWCGLWRLKETGETEVGYAVAQKFWRRGFATEAAEVCLHYGFNELNLKKIVAVTRPENERSRRVMERLGMRFDSIGRFYDLDLAHYSIDKSDWEKRRNGDKEK